MIYTLYLSKWRNIMKIWLPNVLYHLFPLLSVVTGFMVIALIPNPFGLITAACLYAYSYRILWLRLPGNDEDSS